MIFSIKFYGFQFLQFYLFPYVFIIAVSTQRPARLAICCLVNGIKKE